MRTPALVLVSLFVCAAPAVAEVSDDQIAGWADVVLDDIAITSAEDIQRRVSACYAEVYDGASDLVERCTTMHFTASIIEQEMARTMNMEVSELYRNEIMAGIIATHFERAGKSVEYRNAFAPRAIGIIHGRMRAWMERQ
ncbi:MAG: hypothetical protein OEN23_08260 [Paracoccaceae bacterium]|nr:hypothetical protein [Paracoccaceae bacterium]